MAVLLRIDGLPLGQLRFHYFGAHCGGGEAANELQADLTASVEAALVSDNLGLDIAISSSNQ